MINGVWDTVWVNSTVRSSASGMEQAFWIVARHPCQGFKRYRLYNN